MAQVPESQTTLKYRVSPKGWADYCKWTMAQKAVVEFYGTHLRQIIVQQLVQDGYTQEDLSVHSNSLQILNTTADFTEIRIPVELISKAALIYVEIKIPTLGVCPTPLIKE
jgi:hypothetical protein